MLGIVGMQRYMKQSTFKELKKRLWNQGKEVGLACGDNIVSGEGAIKELLPVQKTNAHKPQNIYIKHI